MTDDEALALGKRVVACRGWRWMPGMLTTDDERMSDEGWPDYEVMDFGASSVVETVEWRDRAKRTALPDLTDPATLGCLLALVREAFPGCHAEPNGAPEWDGYDEAERDNWWAVFTCGPHRLMANGATEAAALVAALEAVP
jgi:hypothetical protein